MSLKLTSDLSVFRNSWTRSLSDRTFTDTTKTKHKPGVSETTKIMDNEFQQNV